MSGYIVRWWCWKLSRLRSERCESDEEALTLKDALEEKGFADVTVEEGEG